MCDWIASKAQQAFSISKITGVVREGKKGRAAASSLAVRAWRQDGKFLHRFGESVLATFGFSEYLRIASSVTVFGWDLCSTSRPPKV